MSLCAEVVPVNSLRSAAKLDGLNCSDGEMISLLCAGDMPDGNEKGVPQVGAAQVAVQGYENNRFVNSASSHWILWACHKLRV